MQRNDNLESWFWKARDWKAPFFFKQKKEVRQRQVHQNRNIKSISFKRVRRNQKSLIIYFKRKEIWKTFENQKFQRWCSSTLENYIQWKDITTSKLKLTSFSPQILSKKRKNRKEGGKKQGPNQFVSEKTNRETLKKKKILLWKASFFMPKENNIIEDFAIWKY